MLNDFSFSPFRRIRQRVDFKRTFRRGKRLYSPLYILYYHFNHLEYPRMGVIVSKRSAKKAVRRNQIKRMAREVFRLRQAALKSVDIVLVAQKKANEASKEELKECLEQLLKKLVR